MNDVSFFWVAFGAYLGAALVLFTTMAWRGADRLARVGRGLVWLGLLAHSVSIGWRAFVLGTDAPTLFFEKLASAMSAGPAWRAVVFVLIFVVPLAGAALALIARRNRLVWLPVLAVAFLVELILFDFLDFTRMPIEKVYEYLSLAAWGSAVGLLAISPRVKLAALDATMAAGSCLLTVFAAVQPKSIELQLVPALQSYWLFIHVSLTSLAYAIFALAFVVGAMLLVRLYDRSRARGAPWRRLILTSGVAKMVSAALVAAVVLSGLTLSFRQVAYAPVELSQHAEGHEADKAPPVRPIHIFRYGAALLGAYSFGSFVLFWLLYPLLRHRGDQSGIGSFLLVVCALAFFAACLVLAGVVRGQESAISRLHQERGELSGLAEELQHSETKVFVADGMASRIERLRALARQARTILAKARWLPLDAEKHARLGDDPLYRSLAELYRQAGARWKTTIRYKDIKQIGRELRRRANLLEAVAARLTFPADLDTLRRLDKQLYDELVRRETSAILPRGPAGQLAAFVGLATLISIPIGLALWVLLPRMAERLPSAESLDRIGYGAIAVGYPLFTFGALFAGAIWAHFAWGAWWSWDPKEVGSLVAWVLYTVYLHQRHREGMSPRVAAIAAVLGFIACTLSLAGNAFLGGLHAYS